MKGELSHGPFLFIDDLPPSARAQASDELRKGQVQVRQVNAKEEGHPIEVPHGLIHDWVGVIFIPHATLTQVLKVARDYDHYQDIYKPEIRASRVISHNGDHFQVHMQLFKKSVATVVMNADYDITYEPISAEREACRSISTHLAEIENFGQKNERELSPANGHGYLWRLNTYWRYEEKDGGVYVQLESIGLSRSIPTLLSWIVNPLLRSVPRNTLSTLLFATRKAVEAK